MAYWSNIQNSWVNWGVDWKNLWIPNYKWLYIWYFINDYVINRYLKIKYFMDNKLNQTFMYYYDFYIQKTYDKIFLFLKKYNIDFSWFNQAAYIGKLLVLQSVFAWPTHNDFYTVTMWTMHFINFYFKPQAYYYFSLLKKVEEDFSLLNLSTVESEKFHKDDWSIIQTLSGSFFIAAKAFSTKANFFENNNFEEIEEFHDNFEDKNISNFGDPDLKPKYVYDDKFRLANFLFNPTLLSKYPKFTFYYNNWLHKSWQLSKKMLLESLKLYSVEYSHSNYIDTNVNYFFSYYIWFFFCMWELNKFFSGDLNLGVGITQEFIWKQIDLLHLKLYLWNWSISKIKEIWFYLKAYLRYFSYEGKINVNRSRLIFSKLFNFSKFLKTTIVGFNLSVYGLIGFLKVFYFAILDWKFLLTLVHLFLKWFWFFKKWLKLLNKAFIKSIKLIWWIIWIWKINIFLKLKILHFTLNFFSLKKFKNKKLFLVANPVLKVGLKNSTFYPVVISFNTILALFLFSITYNFIVKKTEKKVELWLNFDSFFLNQPFYTLWSNSPKFLLRFYNNYIIAKQILKHSDWLSFLFFQPNFIELYFKYSYPRIMFWWKNFFFFYLILSHLTPKLFFWIITDLNSIPHFGLLVHLSIIFWQNFFFFYLFILKCLKWLYALCTPEYLLYLTRPLKMFMQWSLSYITMLDLFSTSFINFLGLGLLCLETNFTKGNKWHTFTIVDVANRMVFFGKPNCWLITTEDKYMYLNKFSYTEQLSESPFFIPFISLRISSKVYKKTRGYYIYEKYNWLLLTSYSEGRVPTHLIIEHFSNLKLNSTLIAVFVKKKLEREHLVAEVLWSLNTLVSQAWNIKGFMFLLKGRFSWKERAAKVWLKKGKLEQVSTWTKVDYCKLPVLLKYGAASVRIWLLLDNEMYTWRAAI